MAANCSRCSKPCRGRFCDEHRREHAAKLTAQLDAIVADHAVKVREARAVSAAKIPQTCGHEPTDLRVEAGVHFCGRCHPAPVADPSGDTP